MGACELHRGTCEASGHFLNVLTKSSTADKFNFNDNDVKYNLIQKQQKEKRGTLKGLGHAILGHFV